MWLILGYDWLWAIYFDVVGEEYQQSLEIQTK